MNRFTSKNDGIGAGVDNHKALLHDLDSRFDNQDRMINYLIQQLGSLENGISGSHRLSQNLQEKDRDAVLRLQNEYRNNTDQLQATISDLGHRLNNLQSQLQADNAVREELRAKLRNTEDQNN